MADDRWPRVKALFLEALEWPDDRRDALLAERTAGDAALGDEVRSLLRSHEGAGSFIETPAVVAMAGAADGQEERAADLDGSMAGPYRIVREIAHGGMGTVYLAVRADGAFDKQVAVKIVRRGLDTEEILSRFRHERQTLAGFDHPNIARLLDAGTTGDGLPYFVMEYVEGIPIDRYADERRLTIAQRLELFRTVCAAVNAAHQNLVVHRDLKPDNILVTRDGQLKLVDFGIAKVLAPEAAAAPQTREVERVMTPEYASPEQILGQPVTTAADVYSLGVLLYELLTGHRPFRRAGNTPDAFVRELAHRPERPSDTVLRPHEDRHADGGNLARAPETVAALRRTSPAGLRRQLAGDLDTIVSVAMRLEPHRRYGSAERLAEDVRRHLTGLPILARRDALGYRVRKFARRNAAGVAVAAMLLLMLVAGVIGVIWQARVAALERDRARVEAEKAQQISAFLQDMLRAPDPQNEGRTVTVVDTLDRAARRLETEPAADRLAQAPLRRALGVTYGSLGQYEAAEIQLRAALAAARSASTDAARAEAAEIENELAEVVASRGDFAAAESLYRHALAEFDALGSGDLLRADAMTGLGEVVLKRGDDDGGEALYREALEIRRRLLGEDDVLVAESLNNLAVVMHGRNNLAEAERLYREALRIVRAARGNDHPGVPAALTNLATVLGSRGNLAEGERLYREALAIRRRLLGEDHPDLAFTRYALADTLMSLGRHGEAVTLCREILAGRGRSLVDAQPVVAASLLTLGKALLAGGDARAAEAPIREALTIRQSNLPPGHWLAASAECTLGRCLVRQRRFREAEDLLVPAFERLSADRGPEHERTIDAVDAVIELYDAWRKPDKAAEYRARRTP